MISKDPKGQRLTYQHEIKVVQLERIIGPGRYQQQKQQHIPLCVQNFKTHYQHKNSYLVEPRFFFLQTEPSQEGTCWLFGAFGPKIMQKNIG